MFVYNSICWLKGLLNTYFQTEEQKNFLFFIFMWNLSFSNQKRNEMHFTDYWLFFGCLVFSSTHNSYNNKHILSIINTMWDCVCYTHSYLTHSTHFSFFPLVCLIWALCLIRKLKIFLWFLQFVIAFLFCIDRKITSQTASSECE